MKQFITTITFTLLFISAAFAREQTVLARVTVYWASRDAKQQQAAYNGARLRPGHCAVDPDRIPYGSKVVFADGAECKAIDTGPAVVSRKAARLSGRNAEQREAIVVDRYFETKEEALAWADTHPHFMTLQVVIPGSKKRSVPEHGTMLAQAKAPSIAPAEMIMTVQASSGLKTLDATALAFLPLIPLLWVKRRRIVRVGPSLRYA
jgi:3D (Asp-Asp-Asp) domain-containing protein